MTKSFHVNRPLRFVHTERRCHVHVTNATLMGKMGMQPILPVTLTVGNIKGAARQHYIDSDVDWTVTLGVSRSLHMHNSY